MTKQELQEVYREKILPESTEAYHFEERNDANLVIDAYNPMCGDKYKLFVFFDGEKVDQVYFYGIGCAVSKASTSILIQELEGMQKPELFGYIKNFRKSLQDRDTSSIDNEKLKILVELMNFDGREDCIELSWKALEESLDES